MTRKFDNNCAFCKVLLLPVFLVYYCSLTLFYHPHLISGQVVYHSHPYKYKRPCKTGEKKSPAHRHNKEEFYHIQQLDKSVWDDLTAKSDLPASGLVPKEYIVSELPARLIVTANTAICLRAPPAIPRFV